MDEWFGGGGRTGGTDLDLPLGGQLVLEFSQHLLCCVDRLVGLDLSCDCLAGVGGAAGFILRTGVPDRIGGGGRAGLYFSLFVGGKGALWRLRPRLSLSWFIFRYLTLSSTGRFMAPSSETQELRDKTSLFMAILWLLSRIGCCRSVDCLACITTGFGDLIPKPSISISSMLSCRRAGGGGGHSASEMLVVWEDSRGAAFVLQSVKPLVSLIKLLSTTVQFTSGVMPSLFWVVRCVSGSRLRWESACMTDSVGG